MNARDLEKIDPGSYGRVRKIIVVLAAICPLAIVLLGLQIGIVPDSLSEYYYAGNACLAKPIETLDDCKLIGQFIRDLFVGSLCAIGVLQILYRGYSQLEDWALNLAGFCAIVIALSPMAMSVEGLPSQPWPDELHGQIHLTSLTAFVFLIAYVAVVCSETTLQLMESEATQRRYRLLYRILGIEMVCMPIIVIILSLTKDMSGLHILLIMEVIYIWSLAIFWFLKSKEISMIRAQLR